MPARTDSESGERFGGASAALAHRCEGRIEKRAVREKCERVYLREKR